VHEDQGWAGACYDRLGDILVAVNTRPSAAVNVLVCNLASSSGVLW
jgi:hypothetical protein